METQNYYYLSTSCGRSDGASKENLHFDDQSKQVIVLFFVAVLGYDIILWIRIARDQFLRYQDFLEKDSPASASANWIIQTWVCCHLFAFLYV